MVHVDQQHVLFISQTQQLCTQQRARLQIEGLARVGDWDGFAVTFFRDVLRVPAPELDALRTSELWLGSSATRRPLGATCAR